MANVLIIGINYRPETTGIAPYTSAMAEHLARTGHRVTVITGFAHYPAWRREPGERRWRAVETRDDVRLLRRRHYVPGSQSAVRRALYEASFLVHGVVSNPDRSDVVLGVVPSLSGGILARHFAARAGAPYGIIFQDLMAPAARQSGIEGGVRVARITGALERWAVARARTVAVASESFRPYLQDIGVADDRVVSLPNWVQERRPPGSRSAIRERLGWSRDLTVVLHAGNMGLKQGLSQVVAAARRADELAAPVRYVLMGEGSQRAALEAAGRGIERLEFLPFQPEDEVADILHAADVLLVSERASVIDMSLPSKLTAYFSAGRPIVAAVPADGSTAREIERSRAGVLVRIDEPDAMTEAVLELRHDPRRAARLGLAGRRYASTALNLDTALERIDQLLARTLRPAQPVSPQGSQSALDSPEPVADGPRAFDLLGVRIAAAPFHAVVKRALLAPNSGERLSVHFATAHTLVESQENPALRAALESGLVQPDGMPLVWLGRASGLPVERVCGPDFMPALIEAGIESGRTHYFYGGAPGVPDALAARLKARYPGLRVAGTLSPPFRKLSAAEEEAIIARINAAAPDYLWVGLGTPKQDLWLAANRSRLNAPVILAVGAAFDFLAGRRRRAPRWMQRSGTEWIYRLATEPRRLGSRYTRVNARFLRLVLADRLRRVAGA